MYSQPTLNVVIPVYREGNHLNVVIQEVIAALEKVTNKESYQIILIDDGSPDNTWDVIKQISQDYPILKAVRLSRNFGKECALCAGLEMAKGDAVIIMDGDLQHPPHLIPEMVSIWQKSDADIVEAIKISRGNESFSSKIGAEIFYAILNQLSGYNLKGASDYKLLDRKVVNAWLRMGERNLFFRGMTAWLGFQRIKIPFEVASRISGRSRWSTLNLMKLAITGVTSFSSLPLHLITFSGCLFLTFAIILGLQTLFFKLTGRSVDGFTTVILLLLIIGSLIMISLGIIGLYLARIYEEVKCRPRYIISEIIDEM
ncbi:glycosyltransferase family 2 protein [Nostoc sp. TCL26-01]|uniref:glycosyltransferase family 2 protein n=1 Tax=Nostoc sp. TCL26-01 TaxID=2576904 RepID=UPI0015BEE563|nr:glycosyltransferase family 2 protein [Nostoc sp. TCL26-01]QLE57814.1 glycosyltransferase family 2 protein [Nostoc sp. TCL26-01]